MAIYIPKLNLLFVQTPGTGSTSIEKALLALDGASSVGKKHDSYEAVKAGIASDASPEVTVLTFVRNPFDWYVAEWWRLRNTFVWELLNPASFYSQDPLKRKELVAACRFDFDKWIEFVLLEMYTLDKKDRVCMFEYYTHSAQNVFKFEEMSGFARYFETQYKNKLDIPHVNDGKREKPYWQFYTQRARDVVQEISSITLKRYAYCF